MSTPRKQFRILIIGDTKAGKSTLLKKWCETGAEPIVRNQYGELVTLPGGSLERGNHNVYDEYTFQKRPEYVFHDSCGFEGGSTTEMDDVKRFIAEKSGAKTMKGQLHLIWHCIPAGGPRLFTDEEIQRIQLYDGAAGSVPVIAIFTKLDAEPSYSAARLRGPGQSLRQALSSRTEGFHRIDDCIRRLNKTNHRPAGIVQLKDMHKSETPYPSELTTISAEALDDTNILNIFISLQKNSVELRIRSGIERVMKEKPGTARDMSHHISLMFGIYQKNSWWDLSLWSDSSSDSSSDDTIRPCLAPKVIQNDLDISRHVEFIKTLGSLIIIHEHVFQLVESGSTKESLNALADEVAADFNTNYHQQWADAVQKHSWRFKRRKDIVSQLTGLIMEHLMPVSLNDRKPVTKYTFPVTVV